MGGLSNEPIPDPHVPPKRGDSSDHIISTSCGVAERPGHHCGDDLVFNISKFPVLRLVYTIYAGTESKSNCNVSCPLKQFCVCSTHCATRTSSAIVCGETYLQSNSATVELVIISRRTTKSTPERPPIATTVCCGSLVTQPTVRLSSLKVS